MEPALRRRQSHGRFIVIPDQTSAVPMTFLHNGRQYIVFDTGAAGATLGSGNPNPTAPHLVTLTLPNK